MSRRVQSSCPAHARVTPAAARPSPAQPWQPPGGPHLQGLDGDLADLAGGGILKHGAPGVGGHGHGSVDALQAVPLNLRPVGRGAADAGLTGAVRGSEGLVRGAGRHPPCLQDMMHAKRYKAHCGGPACRARALTVQRTCTAAPVLMICIGGRGARVGDAFSCPDTCCMDCASKHKLGAGNGGSGPPKPANLRGWCHGSCRRKPALTFRPLAVPKSSLARPSLGIFLDSSELMVGAGSGGDCIQPARDEGVQGRARGSGGKAPAGQGSAWARRHCPAESAQASRLCFRPGLVLVTQQAVSLVAGHAVPATYTTGAGQYAAVVEAHARAHARGTFARQQPPTRHSLEEAMEMGLWLFSLQSPVQSAPVGRGGTGQVGALLAQGSGRPACRVRQRPCTGRHPPCLPTPERPQPLHSPLLA